MLLAELNDTRRELECAENEIAYLRHRLTEREAEAPNLDEIQTHIRRLIALCHPDKHNGSTAAHDETLWLLDLRQRLK